MRAVDDEVRQPPATQARARGEPSRTRPDDNDVFNSHGRDGILGRQAYESRITRPFATYEEESRL